MPTEADLRCDYMVILQVQDVEDEPPVWRNCLRYKTLEEARQSCHDWVEDSPTKTAFICQWVEAYALGVARHDNPAV